MTFERRPLGDSAGFLESLGPDGVFARYLLQRVPTAHVRQWRGGGDRDIAVGGVPHGHFEVSFTWVFSDLEDAVLAFVSELVRDGRVRAYVPNAHGPAVARSFPTLSVTEDHLYLRQADRVPVGPPAPLIQLTSDGSDAVSPEISELFPPPALWDRIGFLYYGIPHAGTVVAVAECTVDDGDFAAIQQVRTAHAHRRQGLGRRVVDSVAYALGRRGRASVYICAADNEASGALARSAGFSRVAGLTAVQSK